MINSAYNVRLLKIYLQEVGCVGMDWIELAQNRGGGAHL